MSKYISDLSDRMIGPDGTIHLAYLEFKSPEERSLYYLEGQGIAWKQMLVTGYTVEPAEMLLGGTVVDPNGRFCLLLEDHFANSLVLGCLESMSS